MEQLKNYHSNREIKFRLWDFEEKKMIYPSLSHDEKYVLQLNCEYMGKFNGKTYDTIKIPKMEFSGMCDKEGKEVYEGDILKSKHSLPLLVVFQDGKFCFSNSLTNGSDVLSQMRVEKLNIIGNVYQNPELL